MGFVAETPSLHNGSEANVVDGSIPLSNGDGYSLKNQRYNGARSWVVQKFGGTSIGKFATTIASDIIGRWLETQNVVAVCSARSGSFKAAGTTNRLLRASKDAANRNTEDYHSVINQICADHLEQVDAHISSPEIQSRTTAQINGECARLRKFLGAIQEIGELSSTSQDKVISFGELLACHLMVGILEDKGISACCVDLSEVIDFEEDTNDINNAFYTRLTQVLTRRLRACGTTVPVVTGYFGKVHGGILNRIGRGYTDLTATLCAVGLEAQELQIWKEVDGVFTANPAKVPTARLLKQISPIESYELSYFGSEVIHPFVMEQAIKANIPIRIRNVMNLRNTGTLIAPEPMSFDRPTISPSSPSFFRKRSTSKPTTNGEKPGRPTAITIKSNVLVLNLHSNKRTLSHGFYANIFQILDAHRLSIDLISTSEVHVSMALHSESALLSSAEDEREIVDASLKGAVTDLIKYGSVDILPNMAILSLVGKQMKNMIGIAGKMFSVLGENQVNIEMISQGERNSLMPLWATYSQHANNCLKAG